ncbi:unnamed protein product, partial [Tetraodon nigroviridis]
MRGQALLPSFGGAVMLRVLRKAESFVCWRKAGLQLAPPLRARVTGRMDADRYPAGGNQRLYMAVESPIWLLCLLSLLCGPSQQ